MRRRRSSRLAHLACGLTFAVASRVSAEPGEPSVIVSYVAPTECATADAFQQLVANQVERGSDPGRPRPFSVTIRRDADFIGTLETEGGIRELHASTCNELAAALATIVAMAQPDASATPPSPEPRPPVVPAIVPVRPTPPAPKQRDETRMASPTLLGVGIAMFSAGVAAIPFGVSHRVTADKATEACPGAATCPSKGTDVIGVAITSAGAGLAVGGVVLAVLGLQQRRVSVEGGPVGSTGATVRVTF